MKPDELQSLIKERRSIRKYTDVDISKEQLYQIIEAARWAPSANNTQPWEFIIVTEKDGCKGLANVFINWRKDWLQANPERRIGQNDYLLDASAFIVVCADPRRDARMRKPELESHHTMYEYKLLSGMGAAIENMLLMITSMGLGSVWLTTDIKPIEKGIKEFLNIPRDLRVITVLPIGKPAKQRPPANKRVLEEILHWEQIDADRLMDKDDVINEGLKMEKAGKDAADKEAMKK